MLTIYINNKNFCKDKRTTIDFLVAKNDTSTSLLIG